MAYPFIFYELPVQAVFFKGIGIKELRGIKGTAYLIIV